MKVEVHLSHKYAVEYEIEEGPDECRALTVFVWRRAAPPIDAASEPWWRTKAYSYNTQAQGRRSEIAVQYGLSTDWIRRTQRSI